MTRLWAWLVGANPHRGDRVELREALKPLVLRPEPSRLRQVYAESDGRERISHVFKVMNFRKKAS